MAQVKVTPSGLTSVPHAGTDPTTVEIVIETDKNTVAPTLTANVFTKDGVELVNTSDTDPVSVATFMLNPGTDAGKIDTGTKKYITMTVPADSITATGDDANLPLRVVVTIPAIGPSDPSDTTAGECSHVSHHHDYKDSGSRRS